MAEDNKPLALNNPQYANLTIILDGTLGVFNVGGIADEGWYSAPITAMGLSVHGDKGPSLAVTLGGIGNGDTYTYLTLPTNPAAEHFQTYQRLLNSFLESTDYSTAGLAAGTPVTPEWLGGFVGRTATVYYYPPFAGPDGKLQNKTQEVFFQSPAQRSAVESGTGKPPPRRNKPPETLTSADVLGHAASSVGAAARPVMPPAAPHAPVSAPVTAPAPAAPAPAAFAPPPPASRPSLPPPPPR